MPFRYGPQRYDFSCLNVTTPLKHDRYCMDTVDIGGHRKRVCLCNDGDNCNEFARLINASYPDKMVPTIQQTESTS